MRSKGSPKELEQRRMRAMVLLDHGWSQADVAQRLDVTQGAVAQCKKKYQRASRKDTPLVHRRALYWVMYGCGLRPGEAYDLTLDNLDMENRRLHVENREATDRVPPFAVKAEDASTDSKERWVPIPEAAIPDLSLAARDSFKSGSFIGLTAQRFASVQRNWRLCRQGQPWGGRAEHRP